MRNHDFTLIIRNGYLHDLDKICDIGIRNERIEEISQEIIGTGNLEIDADGNLVSPGFVDCHTHMDKSLTAVGERRPKYNESPYNRDNRIKIGLEYYKTASLEEIKSHVIGHAHMQVSNGTLFTRTHVDVDKVVKTKAVQAVLEAREELKGLIDIQIVAFAQSGLLPDRESEPLLREALKMGADSVGTLDPATCEGNIEESLDRTFRIATDYDADIDNHLHDRGTLGLYTIKRYAQKALENDYAGRVTSSHSFCLADADERLLGELMPLFKGSGLQFVTCYYSSPYTFPMKKLLEKGIPVGCGSDNIRDFWIPFGSGDMVQGALIETQRFGMRTTAEMDIIWDLITKQGANALGIEGDYGIEVGKRADFVVLDALSPPWAIIEQPKKLYVIKNGKLVAKNGEILT